jgi:hypothetical protein
MIVPESALPKVAPGEAIAIVCDGLRLDAIVETAELAGSYARSAAEAAWRGDRLTLGVHLRQLRLATIAGLRTYNELGAQGENASAS